MPSIVEKSKVTRENSGMRYSRFSTPCKSPPGRVGMYSSTFTGRVWSVGTPCWFNSLGFKNEIFVVVEKGITTKGRNRVEVVPADVLLAAKIEPAVGWHILSAITGDHGGLELQRDDVAPVVVRDGSRSSRTCWQIVFTFPCSGPPSKLRP